MKNPAQTPFGTIFQAEVLLNSKRIAPYALMILFSGNAVLWCVGGAAVSRGWATNSDFYIVRNFLGFCFITGLPLFAAVIMGDAVIRDFRLGVDPLLFSKPVSRAAYLLGKFFGNFFVLVCCQAAFALTLLLMQLFPTSQMIVLPVRVLPYFKHFFFFVVISYLVFAAVYFTVGTLTRNAKIVYGLAISFYPFYIAWQLVLKGWSPRWQTALDPLLFNSYSGISRGRSAEWLDQVVVSYSSDMFANRALMILFAAVCLTILYFRFAIAERAGHDAGQTTTTVLNLSTRWERLYNEAEGKGQTVYDQAERATTLEKVALPRVQTSEGRVTHLKQLIAALGIEFRLLRAERGLVFMLPMVVFLSTFELAFYDVAPGVSYSVTFATSTATFLLLFLFGITVFYTGETMHRDRETRVEPVLWSVSVPNYVLLLSKYLATLLLTLTTVVLVGLIAIVIQLLKGHTSVEASAYLTIYSVVLLPTIALMAAVSIALNVLLRDKYLAYAVSVATGGGLFYLYSLGYNHWLYNPALHQLWTYADLTGAGNNQTTILVHRLYCIAIAGACLSLAHLCMQRMSTRKFQVNGRLTGRSWSALVLIISVIVAIITGFVIMAQVH